MSFDNIETNTINWQAYPPPPTLMLLDLSSITNYNVGNEKNQWILMNSLPQSGTPPSITFTLPSVSTSAGMTVSVGFSDGSFFNWFNLGSSPSISVVTADSSQLYPITGGFIFGSTIEANPSFINTTFYCNGINWFQNNSSVSW